MAIFQLPEFVEQDFRLPQIARIKKIGRIVEPGQSTLWQAIYEGAAA
jgi:hypothetical protein